MLIEVIVLSYYEPGSLLGSSKATNTFSLKPKIEFPRSGYFLLLEVSSLRLCVYDTSKYSAFQVPPPPPCLIAPCRNSPHDRAHPLILHPFCFQTHLTWGKASGRCLPLQGQPRCHRWLHLFFFLYGYSRGLSHLT